MAYIHCYDALDIICLPKLSVGEHSLVGLAQCRFSFLTLGNSSYQAHKTFASLLKGEKLRSVTSSKEDPR